MSDIQALNLNAQAAIAQVLADGSELAADQLIDRVMELGYRYRPYVATMINRAYTAGMLQRVGTRTPKVYRLMPGWQGDLAGPIKHKPAPVLTRPSVSRPVASTSAYIGPAFDRTTLTPSLGVVCQTLEELEGELPPHVGVRIVDALHRQFDEMFWGVE
ncbi:hypothetical protein KWH04_01010 [Xanthomonas campestris pv. trichodesmae]|uniref:Uncharacterized protein n=2 Tax=Xanthomonas citri TaxID=346 RepID=A0AB33C8Y6_XANCI|nr:hypothetical protein [Xanthomonas citri]ASK91079.1 hypothetical protein XcvCFBP7111P_05800 [Xanthomonas citri pv. vignicola]MBV6779249.1 hypothetical protein [Xanthomonas campestris pv. trichodesmae]MBZ3921763.1 hypothetical protein [Xanthomonas campestris pv. trichodesmae]MBZ3926363.1 hypothetical protein [Xanthomonas citri pv. sesbaniae]